MLFDGASSSQALNNSSRYALFFLQTDKVELFSALRNAPGLAL
jgi:hypothetical protein